MSSLVEGVLSIQGEEGPSADVQSQVEVSEPCKEAEVVLPSLEEVLGAFQRILEAEGLCDALEGVVVQFLLEVVWASYVVEALDSLTALDVASEELGSVLEVKEKVCGEGPLVESVEEKQVVEAWISQVAVAFHLRCQVLERAEVALNPEVSAVHRQTADGVCRTEKQGSEQQEDAQLLIHDVQFSSLF